MFSMHSGANQVGMELWRVARPLGGILDGLLTSCIVYRFSDSEEGLPPSSSINPTSDATQQNHFYLEQVRTRMTLYSVYGSDAWRS